MFKRVYLLIPLYTFAHFSYYRNATGKYVTATTGSTVATSIYPTTVTGGSSTPGLATHYSSYPGGAVRQSSNVAIYKFNHCIF